METPTELVLHWSSKTMLPKPPPPPSLVHALEPEPKTEPVRELVLAQELSHQCALVVLTPPQPTSLVHQPPSPRRHTGAGKIAAAPRAPRPTGILPIHACMINSDNEISDSEIISTGIPVLIYRYSLAVNY